MDNDIIPGLNQNLVKAIKTLTEKRLDLVKSQLENIIETANTLQNRGYDHSHSLNKLLHAESSTNEVKRSHFIFELKTELMKKQRLLETLLDHPSKVFRDEFEFYFKVNDPLN